MEHSGVWHSKKIENNDYLKSLKDIANNEKN